MRTGVNAATGGMLTGWDHVVQSVGKALRTRFATRVMRRHLGSLVPEMQDQNADASTIFQLYASIASALNDPDNGDPGFNLRTIELVQAERTGRFVFLMEGDYYPLGHLGNFEAREQRSISYPSAGVPA
jgi:uncharacterized protein